MRLKIVKTLCLAVSLLLAFEAFGQCGREVGLKDAAKGKFLVGVAITDAQVAGHFPEKTALIKKHFNSIVAENTMKPCSRGRESLTLRRQMLS